MYRKSKKRKRIRTIIILTFAIPLYLAVLAFCILGVHVSTSGRIYPNVSIDWIDVSWLTYEEAVAAIENGRLQDYEERWNSSSVSVMLPDYSEMVFTGEEVLLTHDSRAVAAKAYYRGRDNGFVMNTIMYLQHLRYGGKGFFEVSFMRDPELLHSRVAAFAQSYNDKLESSTPIIHADKIVMVKGAGQVRADEADLFEMVYLGLFESFSGGRHVSFSYALPESSADMAELVAMWQDLLIRPLSAEYDPETKTVSDSSVGVGFDLVGAATLLGGTESGKTVSFDIYYTPPEVTREYLEGLLYRDLIAEEVTQIAGTSNRLNNIVLASAEIDGIILEPGEEFSFNRVVGVRSTAKGYRDAPGIQQGRYVPMVGGGICQVSSTIHSAIMDTGLQVTERHAHGLPVAYLPRGRDATVYWGRLDFRFVNNTEHPIRIDIEIEDRTLTVQVYGTIIEP